MGHFENFDEAPNTNATLLTPPTIYELNSYMYREEQNRENLKIFDLE